MFCSKCGKELPEGARFCENCGSPVGEEASLKHIEVSEEDIRALEQKLGISNDDQLCFHVISPIQAKRKEGRRFNPASIVSAADSAK